MLFLTIDQKQKRMRVTEFRNILNQSRIMRLNHSNYEKIHTHTHTHTHTFKGEKKKIEKRWSCCNIISFNCQQNKVILLVKVLPLYLLLLFFSIHYSILPSVYTSSTERISFARVWDCVHLCACS